MAGARIIPLPARPSARGPRRWEIAKDELLTALCLAEEYALNLRVRLYNCAASQDFETAAFTVRAKEQLIQLLGPHWCVSVDLNRTHKVCAIHKGCVSASGNCELGGLALECRDFRGQALLSVSCPDANDTPEGRMWRGILRSLAS